MDDKFEVSALTLLELEEKPKENLLEMFLKRVRLYVENTAEMKKQIESILADTVMLERFELENRHFLQSGIYSKIEGLRASASEKSRLLANSNEVMSQCRKTAEEQEQGISHNQALVEAIKNQAGKFKHANDADALKFDEETQAALVKFKSDQEIFEKLNDECGRLTSCLADLDRRIGEEQRTQENNSIELKKKENQLQELLKQVAEHDKIINACEEESSTLQNDVKTSENNLDEETKSLSLEKSSLDDLTNKIHTEQSKFSGFSSTSQTFEGSANKMCQMVETCREEQKQLVDQMNLIKSQVIMVKKTKTSIRLSFFFKSGNLGN